MATQVLMPALSPTMEKGNLAKWIKNEGDDVKAGDVIAEIETDKATMEVEAVDEGRLGKILIPEGTQGVKVNDVIALLLEEGENASSLEAGKTPKAAQPERKPNGGGGTPQPQPAKAAAAPQQAPAPQAAPSAQPAEPAASRAQTGDNEGRVFASPLARRMAAHAAIELDRS